MKPQTLISLSEYVDKQTEFIDTADYKGYRIEIDRTGYASKEDMYSFFNDDGETYFGSGESIDDCKKQIDEL